MGLRVALLSGGKDSFYAAMLSRPIDVGLMLVYQAPAPSPHLLNLGKSVETLGLAGVPVLVKRLRRGRERADTVEALRKLGADVLVAGDVYVEDHLRYMESVAAEAGAELREPLWGLDPLEALHREAEAGIEALVIGAGPQALPLLGSTISPETLGEVERLAAERGFDPLGERGEYHTVVTRSPLHTEPLSYRVAAVEDHGGARVLRLL